MKLYSGYKSMKYWLHIAILSVILIVVFQYFSITFASLSIMNVIIFTVLIGIVDIVVHSIIKVD